jgi:hypothetical protein
MNTEHSLIANCFLPIANLNSKFILHSYVLGYYYSIVQSFRSFFSSNIKLSKNI